PPGEFTLERTQRRTRCLRRRGIDEIGDGFCLCQVELVIQECTLGELTGLRQPRTKLHTALDQQVHDQRAAVALQLKQILAGVGTWRRKEQRDPFVDELVLRVTEFAERCLARRELPSDECNQQRYDSGTGDTHDAYAATASRR